MHTTIQIMLSIAQKVTLIHIIIMWLEFVLFVCERGHGNNDYKYACEFDLN